MKKKDDVDFFEIEVWNKQAEICNEYLVRGRAVIVEGRLKQDRWEDDTGKKRSKIKIISSSVQFLPRNLDEDTKKQELEHIDEQIEDPNLPF